ncbi:MAG: Rod binding protein [Rhodobacteraceae bacterium HLUCCA12]|nr:MAG: Rod binding protein [Rhodobacteraceae bacterium HLUCCA12]
MHIPADLSPVRPPAPAPSALRQSAEALETAFLAQMLKSAGIGQPPDSMNGGPGEEHFASFMTEAHARALMARGGLGLADHVERALMARGPETEA